MLKEPTSTIKIYMLNRRLNTVNVELGRFFAKIKTDWRMDTMDSQDGLKTIALPLFLNIFFYFLLQLLCVMISHWLTVLKHKMPRQILFLKAGLVW